MESRDRRIVRQWKLDGAPRATAVGADGTIYAGLAHPQAVVAINGDTGDVLARKVVDQEEIASTKDFVSMRTTAAGDRLIIANGSDESAMIMSLPDLAIVREIGVEGELIRDAVPAPDGSWIALLGRDVHVWSRDGRQLIRVLRGLDPMALAASSDGKKLAVVSRESFPAGAVSVAVLFDTDSWQEVARRPLQTERRIRGAEFVADDDVLLVWADDWLAEAGLAEKAKTLESRNGENRITIGFGDLVSSENICLTGGGGPQQVALAARDLAVVAERRCSASGSMTGARRTVRVASLVGVEPWSIAIDPRRRRVIAADPAGTLTIYSLPSPSAK